MKPTLIYYVAASLDGYIARPDGRVDWLEATQSSGDDHGYHAFYDSIDALLISYIVSVLFQEASFRGFGALLEFNEFVLRISIASFLAYVLGQFLDIQVFDRLRQLSLWWVAPTVSTVLGNLLDTYAFFSVAFWNSSNPFMAEHWVEIATVDYGVKLAVSLLLFVPLYGMLLNAILRMVAGRTQAAS